MNLVLSQKLNFSFNVDADLILDVEVLVRVYWDEVLGNEIHRGYEYRNTELSVQASIFINSCYVNAMGATSLAQIFLCAA